MSGSALMTSHQVNLDEFEQRLRMAGSPVGPQEDPLEELARLVGAEAREPASKLFSAPPPSMRLPQAPLLRVPPAVDQENRADEADFADKGMMDEASLRGALDDVAPTRDHRSLDEDAHAEGLDHDDAPLSEPATPVRRRSRAALTMGVLVAVGAVSGGGALWVLKGAPGLPKTPPVIMAADGPTKVQPPSQDTVSSPSDSASVLLKDQANKPGPVSLVSRQEQPVDLQQATATPASVAPPALVVASAAAAPVESAASAPARSPVVPPAPALPTRSIALTTVGPTTAPPAAPSPFPEPKRVKTVSVRPDGSVISTGSEPVVTADAGASAGAPAAPAAAAAAPADASALPAKPPVPRARPSTNAAANGAPQPATPKVDLPTKLAPPKSTARVPVARTDTTVPVAKTDTTAPGYAPQSPDTAVPNFFDKMAKAVTGQPEQQQVATADPVATSRTTAGGAWAVQLAAPPSQKEAEGVSAHLQAKYSADLGGMQPTIHQADSNGKTIYRVRLSGMSKAEAVSLCQKLKASGGEGACFVAKD
jgi:hypothetical protein